MTTGEGSGGGEKFNVIISFFVGFVSQKCLSLNFTFLASLIFESHNLSIFGSLAFPVYREKKPHSSKQKFLIWEFLPKGARTARRENSVYNYL